MKEHRVLTFNRQGFSIDDERDEVRVPHCELKWEIPISLESWHK